MLAAATSDATKMLNFPLSVCITVISLEAGIWSVRAIPVQCSMTNNKVSEAGRWPDTVGTYHNDPDWTELRYYRLRCKFTRVIRNKVYRVYRDHWKRPFEKVDCERSGCVPIIWNTISGGQPIIDVYWSSVIKFATTAPLLKICQVDAVNPNSTIFTTSQLNDLNLCQPSGRFSPFGSVTNSGTIVKDFFMHVSSDMFSEEEIERVNDGEDVVVTIDRDCSAGYKFRDGCDIMIVSSPFAKCSVWIHNYHHNAAPHNGLELTELHDNTNGLIAYKYRMTAYKLYSYIYSNIPGGEFVNTLPRRRSHKPVHFEVICKNYVLKSPFRERISKGFTIITLYWPSSRVINRNNGEIGLILGSTQLQESVIDVAIVTAINVTSFQVKRILHSHNKRYGEFTIAPRVHYPYNHTTVYSIVIPSPLNHEGYQIIYRLAEVDLDFSVTFYLTIRREINMVISPMKIVVVRGDRSVRPYYVCLATSIPHGLNFTWSKEIGPLQGEQAPLQDGDFRSGIEGSYLRFPLGSVLTNDYTGEYTCTAIHPVLGSRKMTAIFVVLEPGSYYSIFRPHWVPISLPSSDVAVTEEEQALFHCIHRPVITEPGKLSCTNGTAIGGKDEGGAVQTLAITSSTIVGIAAVLLAVVLIYRWYRRRMRVRDDASSDGEVDITSSSENLAADSDEGSSMRLVKSSSSNEMKFD